MAVKFEFILDDVDAENLISIIDNARQHAERDAFKFESQHPTQVSEANATWYRRHAVYLGELKQKITAGSSRADEESTV